MKDELITPPNRHYWQVFAVEGPFELYKGFAFDAVDIFLEDKGEIDEDQLALILAALNVGVTVALKAAGVSDSWLPQYEAAVAHLKEEPKDQ